MKRTTTKNKLSKIGAVFLVLLLVFGSVPFSFTGAGQVFADALTSQNLADFLKVLTIDAEKNKQGQYIVKPGVEYALHMNFTEQQDLQFANSGWLIYDFPQGINVDSIGETGFDIKFNNGQTTISGNTYKVESNQLKIKFTDDKDLQSAANVEFTIDIQAKFVEVEKVEFSPNVEITFDYGTALTIKKTGVYNKTEGKINYKLKVKADGAQTNLIIKDVIEGTALTLDSNSVVATSNLSGHNLNEAVLTTPFNNSNAFSWQIGSVAHEEEITLTYSATIDFNKITLNKDGVKWGSVAETNNTATADSAESDEVSTSLDFAGKIKFSTMYKSNKIVDANDPANAKRVDWTITVNSNFKLNMNNREVMDFLTPSAKTRMHFTGQGVEVKVYEEGNPDAISTYNVSWSELSPTYKLPNDNTSPIVGWTYKISNDHNYKYVIKVRAVADVSDITAGGFNFRNGIKLLDTSTGDMITSTNNSVLLQGNNHMTIEKEVREVSGKKIKWQITLSGIPKEGFSTETRLIDSFPKLYSWNDTAIMDTINVVGLINSESFKLVPSTDPKHNELNFYFYKDQAQNEPGLSSSDKERTITITIESTVDQDWLNAAAKAKYKNSTYNRHKNAATFRTRLADNHTTYLYDNAVAIPKEQVLTKTFSNMTMAEVNSVDYPVFNYQLELLNPQAEPAVINDVFDTTYLKFYDDPNVFIKLEAIDGNGDVAATWDNVDNLGVFTVNQTDSGADITIAQFPKDHNKYYSRYKLCYALIVKDKTALDDLKAAAEVVNEGGFKLANTATWGVAEPATATAEYVFSPKIDKLMLAQPSSANGYNGKFKIVVNENGEKLNSLQPDETLVIVDRLSPNLRFKLETLKYIPDLSTSIQVHYDQDANAVTFSNIPNQKKVLITYDVRVLGASNTSQDIWNEVSLGSFMRKVTKKIKIESSGSGSASNPSITIRKIDKDTNIGLPGAKFDLYKVDGTNETRVKDKHDVAVSFTTGDNGTVLVEGNQSTKGWVLIEDTKYRLKEVIYPEGYVEDGTVIDFVLKKDPVNKKLDYELIGATINIENTKKTYKLGNYVWYDNNRDGLQNDGTNGAVEGVGAAGVKVELFEKVGNDYVSTNRTTTTNDDGYYEFDGLVNGDYQVKFTELPEGYQITETDVNGSGDDTNDSDGLTPFGPIADADNMTLDLGIVKEQIEIEVKKAWVGPAADSVIVKLFADDDQKDSIELNVANNWKHTFDNLDKYNANGVEINYTVTEEPVAGYDAIISGSVKDGFVITNTKTGKISIPVEKKWVGPELDAVTVNLLANGAQVATEDLSATSGWTHTFADMPMYDNNGAAITYTIEEVTVANYDSVITGSAANGFVITNTNNEKVSVDVEKQWNGKQEDSATIKLLADGVEVGSIELNEANNWKHTFDNLAKYNANGDEMTYTVEEVTIPGYAVEVHKTTGSAFGFVVTNTNTETVEVYVKKVWVGGQENSVEIDILANGVVKQTVTLVTNAWQKFVGLFAKYDANGNEIVYTAQETPIAGYTTTYATTTGSAMQSTGSAITLEATNTKKPTYKLGDYVWYDSNKDGIQDAGETGVQGVTVTLTKADGTVITSTTTDASGNYLFENLQPGDYKVIFSNLPAEHRASLSNQGSDDAKDSDGLSVDVTITNANDLTIDLGIYKRHNGGGSTGGGGSSTTTTAATTTTSTTTTTTEQPTEPTTEPPTETPTEPTTEPTTVPVLASTTSSPTEPATESTTVSTLVSTTEQLTEPTTVPTTTQPTYISGNTPDPNNSNTPEVIVVIDDNGTPLGTYHKKVTPDGDFIYVDENGVPLGTTKVVKTGNDFPEVIFMMIAVLSLIGAFVLRRAIKKATY